MFDAGACVVSTSAPALTHSELTTATGSSSPVLVNFTYVNISAASSAPPLQLVHPTSTMTPPDGDELTSSVTEAAVSDTSSRDLADMHMHNSSVAAAVTSTSPVSSSSPVAIVSSNASDKTSFEVQSEFTNITAGVPTSSGLPGDVASTDDISRSPSSTIPDADWLTTSSVSVTVSPEYFRPSPLWTTIITVVLCLLALVVLLVILVVCLSRARSRHKLCWTKHRCYLPVPLFYQNGSRTAVVLDPSASGSVTTVGNGGMPAKGPELAPLTYV